MNKQLIAKLGGTTSDHTFVSYEVTVQEGRPQGTVKPLSVRVATWNMLNQCHSKATCKHGNYANNPFNIDETDQEYRDRKVKQLDQIKSMIVCQGESHPLDVILLQEADWCRDPQLLEHYQTFLGKLGWGMIVLSQPRALVALYNTKSMKPKDSPKGVLKSRHYRAAEQIFIHIDSDKPIAFANFHGDYNEQAYPQKILDYQMSMIAKNMPLIIAGDTNHTPNAGVLNMCCDWHTASNIERTVDCDDDDIKVTDCDVRVSENEPVKKRYDGLFASPGLTSRVTIREAQGEYFAIHDNQVSVRASNVHGDNKIHVGEFGMPWMRTRHCMQIYAHKYFDANTPFEKNNWFNRMQALNLRVFKPQKWDQYYSTTPYSLEHYLYVDDIQAVLDDRAGKPVSNDQKNIITFQYQPNKVSETAAENESTFSCTIS